MLTKSKFLKCLGVMCLTVTSVTAFAQPTPPAPGVEFTTPVPEGTTDLVPVETAWFSDGTVALIQYDINYDAANLTPDLAGCGGAIVPGGGSVITVACSNPSAGVVRIAADDSSLNVIDTQTLTFVNFDVSAAAVGIYDLTVTGQVYGDSNSDAVTPGVPVNGRITISGPAYTSTPTPAQGVDLGSVIQGGTDPTAPVLVTNTGAAGTTLTVTGCSITSNASLFSVDSEAQFTVDQDSAGVTRTVSCRASGAIQVHNGVMTCNHDGGAAGEVTPAVYALSCTITQGPQPQFNASPSTLSFEAPQAGDVMPSQQTTISNSSADAADTTLNSTSACVLAGTNADQYSLSGGVTYSLLRTGGVSQTSVLTVSCNATGEGDYNDATVSCPHDGANASPGIIDLTCKVNPAGGAIFRSDPPPNTTTPIGVDVLVDDTPDPTEPLRFFNDAESGDMDLDIACDITAGGALISVLPDISAGIQISPQSSTEVVFSCDTAAEGTDSVTYTCDYTVDGPSVPTGNGGIQQAIYTYTCDVKVPVSDVDPTPEGGTTLPVVIDSAGGTGSTMVEFTEVAGEGENGELLAECSLADGTHYEITAPLPGDYPVAIAAGDPVMVTVEGTDPDDGSSPTDTLTCTYTDSANPAPGVTVTYPLVLSVGGGSARFQVSKSYTDGYDGDVLVRITCDDGLPLQNEKVISPGNPVTFVVNDFEADGMNCSVTEGDAAGYLAAYSAGGDSPNVDDNLDAPGCHFIGVGSGDENTCSVTNTPAPVDVTINKLWFIDGAVGDELVPFAELTLYCDSPIVDGEHEYPDLANDQELSLNGGNWYQEFEGVGDQTYIAQVIPKRPFTSCWVVEGDQPSAVEKENGCKNIRVSVGNGDTCTITNTVFFEGIPTLSQYGLALMALLMLGVGMVGFRRFA